MWIPDGLDPDEAADFAREEVEAEIAFAVDRERESEEQELLRAEARAAAIDAGFERWIEDNAR